MLLERPPLAAWPEQAHPHEGAHGWFQRLAKANGQLSARTLAESLGLNGRDPQPEELLRFSLQFPCADRHHLSSATPLQDGFFFRLRGQSFRRRLDLSFQRPRVCPACLREERYYRSWFDIQVIACCPIHRQALISGSGRDNLAWWTAQVGVTPGGDDLSLAPVCPSSRLELDWASYVLRRAGVTEFPATNWLDDLELHDVIDLCVVLGRAFSNRPSRRRGPGFEGRATAAAAGFDILRYDEGGVSSFIDTLSSRAEGRMFGPDGVYTRARRALSVVKGGTITERIKCVLRKGVAQRGLLVRTQLAIGYAHPEGYKTLQDGARALGLQPQKLRELALRLGLVQPVRSHAECYSFSPDDLAAVREALNNSIEHNCAAERLGIGAADLARLVGSGVFAPLSRIGGATVRSNRYIAAELNDLLSRWRDELPREKCRGAPLHNYCSRMRMTPSDVIVQVLDGGLKLSAWNDEEPGLSGWHIAVGEPDHPYYACRRRRPKARNGITCAEAAARLGVLPGRLPGLIQAGHLRELPASGGRLAGICEDSLVEFAKIYAPPRLYADLLGLPLASVHASLRDAAISRLDFPGMGQTFLVRRDEAIRRLGAEWDLERGGVGPRFWQEFRDHLRSVGSANKLVGGVGCTAGVRSGDASIYATVRVLPAKSAIELEFSAERRTSPTRFNALLEILPEVKATWHNVACRFDEPAGVVRLIEAFRYTEGLSSSRARDIANRIDMRLTALRHRVKHAGRSPSRAAQA